VAPKRELVRIAVAREEGHRGRAILDPTGRMPGRGAYLCRGPSGEAPATDCLELAMRRGGLARALRQPVSGLVGIEHVESVSR
jgi:predicted RNA-binding protein YlxR (DUF448 family)